MLARIEATAITAADVSGVSFADLGLDPRIVEALARLGADEPFPIQVATIPDVIGGRHVLGRGRTGSGKSIAFGAGLVQRLLALGGAEGGAGRPPRALVLANTRELALQLDRTIRPLARAVGLYTAQLYGGVPVRNQIAGLERGVDIVIGTPGRVLDLAKRGDLRLERIAITVLDEADEMCDLGFLDQIEAILKLTPRKSQRMLFSATLDAAVLGLVERWLRDPAVHEVAGEAARGGIDHRVLVVERADKEAVVAQLAGSGGRVLVFVRTRAGADNWAAVLADHGVRAVVLHGDLSQARRQRNLADLTKGKVDVLVATDVAARGIHIDDVRLVVQADPPDEYKTYLHRAGRTGRAGAHGTVVTVIAPSRRRRMQELLERAEIDAALVPASPGGRELDEFQQHR
ncbi:MAG: DEAD/DEAH box helicase [Microbacteriaceae bacterium]|nr:DEAD/DEAH box helicase [Microbacteriaceae bacterium]